MTNLIHIDNDELKTMENLQSIWEYMVAEK